MSRHTQHHHQAGVVLVIGLIILLVLTLIGVSGMQNTSLEEKMAGNLRDRNLAFQAAEAAMRDAEADIRNTAKTALPRIQGVSDFTLDCGASTATTDDDGLCYSFPSIDYSSGVVIPPGFTIPAPGATVLPNSATPPSWPTEAMMTGVPSVPYGRFTGVNSIAADQLSAQPRYIIQALNRMGTNCNSRGGKFCYRITARAQGANPNTVVWLQSIFIP